MVYEYIIKNYQEAEPIFLSDMKIDGMSLSAISEEMNKLCEKNRIEKYEEGIYYIPKKSRLKSVSSINADMIARYKYIARSGTMYGFYSGNTFANQLGISTQVPNIVEIVSNNVVSEISEVHIGKRIFIVRKSVVPITMDNVYVLQLLDLLKNLDFYLDDDYDVARKKIDIFVKENNITKQEVAQYIRMYPKEILRYYHALRLDDILL